MPLEMIAEMLELFGTVVTSDPITAVLFVFGNVLLLGSVVIFGVLALGGIFAALRPTS